LPRPWSWLRRDGGGSASGATGGAGVGESSVTHIEGKDGEWIAVEDAPLTDRAKAELARRAAFRAERDAAAAPFREPLEAALDEVGCADVLIWGSGARKDRYPEAIPILLEWLPRVSENADVAECVVRALGKAWAKEAAPALVDQVRTSPHHDVRWAAADGLDRLWRVADTAALVELALDPAVDADTRVMLLRALGKQARTKEPAAAAVVNAIADPEIGGHALQWAIKHELPADPQAVRQHLDDDRAWARKDARKLLDQLGAG
jgi:HEAT repeat protein